MLPFQYILRNILRRGTRTAATALGIAITTMLVIAMHAFASGLSTAATGTARDDVAVVLGVSAEVDLVRSVITRGHAEVAAASMPGVVSENGQRAASIELHIASRNGNRVGLIRAVTPAAYLVHTPVQVVAGREPRGPYEIMVGALVGARMDLPPEALAIGATMPIEHRDFTIVGHFAAPGTTYEAEIWGRLEDVMLTTKREDVSCVIARLRSPDAIAEAQLFAARRLDLEISVVTERELLRALASSLTPIAALARWMALLAVVAGAFACANTMFAAVLARTRELGTLRALGHSPLAVAVGLVEESALLAFVGGGLGVLLAMAIGDVSLRYPMGALRLQPDLLSRAIGLGAAVVSGVLGGIVPAVRAVRIPLPDAIGGKA
ncbi:MAG: ABC transporter permease [Planctomycetes bacterium]|nr:ABC transporter permease [Planctomycetota bacterium]